MSDESKKDDLRAFFQYLGGLPVTFSSLRPTKSQLIKRYVKSSETAETADTLVFIVKRDNVEKTYVMPKDSGNLLAEMCRESFAVLNLIIESPGDKIYLPGGIQIDKQKFLDVVILPFQNLYGHVHVYASSKGGFEFHEMSCVDNYYRLPTQKKYYTSFPIISGRITIPGENISYRNLLEEAGPNIFTASADCPDKLVFTKDTDGMWHTEVFGKKIKRDNKSAWTILQFRE